ncbi:PepSY1/2 domain-containing protein [Sporosarcina sp. FA9]|uniref:PepSY1/2 domain-containing protein n=1 Tax=Sporosarcina sp. FA9 TaxID=3413030 RepID=UPI003F655057
MNELSQKPRVQIATTETNFTKDDLIKKFRSLFPNQFDYLKSSDFQMGSGLYYPEDETLRYELSFTKLVNGKRIYGSVGFVGEDLEIEQFHYQPSNVSEALFPAKVSKEEAKKIAIALLKKFKDGEKYQFESDSLNYYSRQLLTDPIRYSFSFARTENKVPLADQRIEVSVLGNGEIVGLYRNPMNKNSSTFDDVKQVIDENKVLKKVKENLTVELHYQIKNDYQTNQTNNRSVQLVYQPTSNLRGVHAHSGKWLTAKDYVDKLPKNTKLEKISANPIPPKYNGITKEEAKKITEQALDIYPDTWKLSVQSIGEYTNYGGQEVFSVQYMYQGENGGHGSNLEINKQTGEIIQFYDVAAQMLEQAGAKTEKANKITEQEALAKAKNYLLKWVPSYLHEYANPIAESYYEERPGTYYFNFPRILNGVIVMDDQINVSVAANGSLNSLSVIYQEVKEWPSIESAITKEKANGIFKEALSLKLNYMKQEQKNNHHYDLVYLPLFNGKSFSSLDATSGKWSSLYDVSDLPEVSHPWAKEELNYLIGARILEVKDIDNFDGDAAVTKEEALKTLMNALTYFYDGRFYDSSENKSQTFENIDPKHPLYQMVEQAVEMGIILPSDKIFSVDSPITKEEMAVWHIRALGLELAAKQSGIYKLDFKDWDQVQKEYTGHVALANSLGLFTADKKIFNPDKEVTYAELAVSTIRLAHEIAKKGSSQRYY